MAASSAHPHALELLEAVVASPYTPEAGLVHDVNWCVAPKELWIVGGQAGSGKSSLMLTAAGLLRPLAGTHRVFGRELAALSEDEIVSDRCRIGVVFGDDGRLFTRMTVAENLAAPVCYHQNRAFSDVLDGVREVLEGTGLAHLAARRPGDIPRNLRVRIALARTLMLKPELLFLDNPLSGLDPLQMFWWLEFLASLRSGHALLNGRPMTIIVVTDDLRPWLSAGDRFAMIHDRRWQLLGGAAEVRQCREPFLRAVLHPNSPFND